MFKKVLVALSLVTFTATSFAFDLPKIGGGDKGAASGDVDGAVVDFIKTSSSLADTANRSLIAINSAFASEEALASKKAELARIDKITDPGEKNAAQAKMNKSESAEAEKNLKSADAQEKIKSLSADKQKMVGAAIFNFAIAALSAPGLIDKGQKIVSSVSMTNAMKVLPVKDSIPLLQRFVSDGAGTMTGFAKIAKGANISVPESSATSKPQKVDL
jgi:hypothetical protein